ncbi:MAG: hypothetical protein K9M94_07610 [Spirochaetia bacterium]|nr:hypothetical protein [Spirochaetia bacterium]
MIHKYIEKMYLNGQDVDARRAIRSELIYENTSEDSEAEYEPTEEEIQAAEAEYYAARRVCRYGSPASQVEYITEHGLDAWQQRVEEIKSLFPKPE